MLGLAVPEMVAVVRGSPCHADGEERQERGDEVGAGVRGFRERPSLPVAMPVTSLSRISATAAKTETSAVLRCGLMAEP